VTGDESLRAFWSGVPSARLAGGYEPRTSAERSGEHRLMLAILEDAVVIFVKGLSGAPVNRSEARAARAWLESRDRSLPFAFECICDRLGFDSGYIRRGLQVMHTTGAAATTRFVRRHCVRPPGPACLPVTNVALANGANVERPSAGTSCSAPPRSSHTLKL
jgi:hypothetical protein